MYVFHYYYFRHATSLISIDSGQEKIITVFTIISQTAHLQLTVVSMTFLEVCIHNLQILFRIILFIFIKQFWKEGLNALLNLFYSLNWLLDTYRFMMSNYCWFTTNTSFFRLYNFAKSIFFQTWGWSDYSNLNEAPSSSGSCWFITTLMFVPCMKLCGWLILQKLQYPDFEGNPDVSAPQNIYSVNIHV